MSSFNILAVRSGESPDDQLYPIPGEQADTVEPEAHDGQPLASIVTTELSVYETPRGGSPKRIVRARKLKGAVRATESRLTVACSKYEKGGGWTPWSLGAIPVALTANAVSKVRASRRRRGKMLVGHVRYPWLFSVGFKPSSLPAGHDLLRLTIVDPTRDTRRCVALDISLPRQQSGSDLARQITRLAASYRLEHEADQLDSATRDLLRALEAPPPLQALPKQYVSYDFRGRTQPDAVGASPTT